MFHVRTYTLHPVTKAVWEIFLMCLKTFGGVICAVVIEGVI